VARWHLLVLAPFFRYFMGDLLASTGGSLLATASRTPRSNAANELGVVGNWQALPALAVLVGFSPSFAGCGVRAAGVSVAIERAG
jgi:hypothetical protein